MKTGESISDTVEPELEEGEVPDETVQRLVAHLEYEEGEVVEDTPMSRKRNIEETEDFMRSLGNLCRNARYKSDVSVGIGAAQKEVENAAL
jgi:hypothetical protein